MEFKMIMHIHELLMKDVAEKQALVDQIRDDLVEAEENNEPEKVKFFQDIRSKENHKLWEAESFLKEFENKEWR